MDSAREKNTDTGTLARHLRGPVFTAGTEGYDRERTGYQLLAPHRPATIVGAVETRDVCVAVRFAAATGARVAVQASGHGLGGALSGGVLISTRRMNGVAVNPDAGTAWVEAGATWQQVIDAAAPHGLAPLSGSSPGVGAVSYTLGGGAGLLARRHGFAADHVRRLDVVTADGELRHVTADSDPDLFWALRGGGGNFGVVTGMEIGLVQLTAIYGGGLSFDVERVPDVLEAWRQWTATVPDELTSAVAMLPFPDLPMVPRALRGRHVAQIQISYAGPPEQAAGLVRPLRELGQPLRDTLRELPYTDSGSVFDEPDRPHGYRSANRLLSELDPDALATLPKLAGPSAPVMCVAGLRHLGGALARAPRVPNAVGHREAAFSLTVLSPVEPGEEDAVRAAHRTVLDPWTRWTLGRSLNFTFGPSSEQEVRAAFTPADFSRLSEIRAEHDPQGLFLSNHVLPPGPAH
ncbi:FAD/FMN-containing dehydrogenase [Amycolatopsis marina]|uniref:FAD/FMN-containing dehydrogenase n=1 Tax=Amycolatopsis marina TaxID=490629 RepID=A0A1I1B216_9PSEU|nr:FAD-binding oxidoreductase [Amycolatopsis marina]SFB44399.1 FAD/FMN-containing dehydrogenase [Amycolatopsis marina]